jgi:hypothetical protein
MIASKAVRVLKTQCKKPTDKDIIHVLDNLDTDEDFEITDELIEEIKTLFNAPIDHEKEALKEANRRFNQNVKGIITQELDDDDDDWVPSAPVDEDAKKKWDEIQDKLDVIKNRYEEMTS